MNKLLIAVDENLRRMIPQINHVSMKMPSFPVLSQPEQITNETFCNPSAADECSEKFCFCTYKMDLPLNQTVEIIFVDEGIKLQPSYDTLFNVF